MTATSTQVHDEHLAVAAVAAMVLPSCMVMVCFTGTQWNAHQQQLPVLRQYVLHMTASMVQTKAKAEATKVMPNKASGMSHKQLAPKLHTYTRRKASNTASKHAVKATNKTWPLHRTANARLWIVVGNAFLHMAHAMGFSLSRCCIHSTRQRSWAWTLHEHGRTMAPPDSMHT